MANQSNKSPFGVGHDGRPKGVPNKPGMSGPARESDAFKGHMVPGNIARDGAPKNHHDVPVHGGMTARQVALKGMQHANATAPDANPASPLSKEPSGKPFVGQPVPVKPGMRSRTNAAHSQMEISELGSAILAEATSDAADRYALRHHGVGTLPPVGRKW